jgi:hypothetical protein
MFIKSIGQPLFNLAITAAVHATGGEVDPAFLDHGIGG